MKRHVVIEHEGWYFVVDTHGAMRTATGIELPERACFTTSASAHSCATRLNAAEPSRKFAGSYHSGRFERAKGAA